MSSDLRAPSAVSGTNPNPTIVSHGESNHNADLSSDANLSSNFNSDYESESEDNLAVALGSERESEKESVSDQPTIQFTIDYSLDVLQTYRKFAEACLDSRDVLFRRKLLDAAIVRLNPSEASQWPSWVPDWRIPPAERPIPKIEIKLDGTKSLKHLGNSNGHLKLIMRECLSMPLSGFVSIDACIDISTRSFSDAIQVIGQFAETAVAYHKMVDSIADAADIAHDVSILWGLSILEESEVKRLLRTDSKTDWSKHADEPLQNAIWTSMRGRW
ncbi:hypothetical protein N0V90_001103 [Kalmusia sp. IMI 367209]|nr:hypothetical protein N0V90_001103 [Kalmusia sp. IMI 367209]